MKTEILLGSGPICKINSGKCSLMPGYIYNGKTGKGCLIGKKVKCKFDRNKFINSHIYQDMLKNKDDLLVDINKYIPEYKWFGKSPYCDTNVLDIIADGYFPVGVSDKYGDGFVCLKGKKMLGIKPYCKKQEKYINEHKQKALEYKEKKKKRNKNIINIFKGIGKKIKQFVSSYYGIHEEAFDAGEDMIKEIGKGLENRK
jgi:hypothetical protein